MGDDLSARLREKATFWLNLAGTVTAGLLTEAADALDAAPPPERVLPEGMTERLRDIVRPFCGMAAHDGFTLYEQQTPGWCRACDDLVEQIVAALSPDSGADPEGGE